MFIMRAIQGFFGIIQPIGFTMISDCVPPANRTFANSFNNLAFFIASLVASILNSFVFPYIPGMYSDNDNLQNYKASMYVSATCFGIGFICSFFVKETCP